jgi:hypothetical protein
MSFPGPFLCGAAGCMPVMIMKRNEARLGIMGNDQYSGQATTIAANVPIKWFGIAFLVILAIFLGWYLYNRRR